jgi:hypothetical protein
MAISSPPPLALQPPWALASSFSFMIIFTDGRTPWASDQLVGRPLPKHRTTLTQNKHIHTPNIHTLSGIKMAIYPPWIYCYVRGHWGRLYRSQVYQSDSLTASYTSICLLSPYRSSNFVLKCFFVLEVSILLLLEPHLHSVRKRMSNNFWHKTVNVSIQAPQSSLVHPNDILLMSFGKECERKNLAI